MEIERVKIKRFFIWKFTLTSFAFGLFLGIILDLILLAISSAGLGKVDWFGKTIDILPISIVESYSFIGIILITLLFAFLGFLYVIFYNTLSRIGFNLDIGLVPVEQKQNEISQQQTAQTIQPAPVANSQQPKNTQEQFY